MMQMALSNAVHPEYGVVTIPFPIPEEEYGHCLELLEALEIGNAVNRDCKVQEVQDGPPILKRLEGSRVNLDELDYLAKRLDSFTDQELAQFQSAAVMLVIHGSAAETKDYERAIILIGSAWGLDPQNAVSHLELITREKEAARGTAEPEETRHVLPESELPMNASGMETLDNVCGLFETAIQLESRDHREALFRLASKLMETQNLLDWIEKTPEEQELPELAES